MNAKEFEKLLEQLDACYNARVFCYDKTLEQAWKTCSRGDWMLFLYSRAKNAEVKPFILVKGKIAETVIPLMKLNESINATKAAIAFGQGLIDEEELHRHHSSLVYFLEKGLGNDADKAARMASEYCIEDFITEYAIANYAADSYAISLSLHVDNPYNKIMSYNKASDEHCKITADICREYLPLPVF